MSCGARSDSVCGAIVGRDLQRLAEVAMPMRAEVGRTFITEGDPAHSFFNVTGGSARLFKSLSDGRRQVVGFAGRGHFLGLAVGAQYGFSAEAIEPVRYCRFSRKQLRIVLDDFPAFEDRLLQVSANELVVAQEQMLLLGRKSAMERLASFLLARSVAGIPCIAPSNRLHLPMTRSDIADYLGLTVETVSRTLTKLKAACLIDLPHPTTVLIEDRPALVAQAGGADWPTATAFRPDADRRRST